MKNNGLAWTLHRRMNLLGTAFNTHRLQQLQATTETNQESDRQKTINDDYTTEIKQRHNN